MEWVDGFEPTADLNLEMEEGRRAARQGVLALYQMIFVDGFVHADLHPGNVRIFAGGDLVLLDTGLVASLPPKQRAQFRDFFFAMAANDGATCAHIVRDTARYLPEKFDQRKFTRAMVEMVNKASGLRAKDFDVAAFARDLFDIQRRFSVRGSVDFTLVILSLGVFEGILRALDPAMDFQREAIMFLSSLGPGPQPDEATRRRVYAELRHAWDTHEEGVQRP
jgi:ubiquinone biosynthesis protein